MSASKHFVVLGLGSFGAALAGRLANNGCRVTGMDADKQRVEGLKDVLYEGAIGDATQRDALQSLSLDAANAVFISLGHDITQSLLATLHAKDLGARRILAKGVTTEHGRILEQLGVERVVFPKIEIAEQLADRLTWPNIIDFVPIDPEYSFMEVTVPDRLAGKTLQQLDFRRRYGVWVVGIKDSLSGQLQMFPGGDFQLGADQLLLVVGKQGELNGLRELS